MRVVGRSIGMSCRFFVCRLLYLCRAREGGREGGLID